MYSPVSLVLVSKPSVSLPSPSSVWGLTLMTYNVYGSRFISSCRSSKDGIMTLSFCAESCKRYKISTPQKMPLAKFPGSFHDTAMEVELVLYAVT